MVNQRIAKQMLADNAAATAADKRCILDGVEEIQWLAALKPSNIGVPKFSDDTRTYLEVAVLSLSVRAGAKTTRLAELVHRAIPYPVLLIVHSEGGLALSLAHIRQAHNEADKTVLDGESVMSTLPFNAIGQSCLQAMALARQPRSHLWALYQGWIDTVVALQAAQLTGHFTASVSREQAAVRRAALRQCHDLTTQMAALRKEAAKEKQLARQVALNMTLLRLTSDLTIAKQHL